MGLIIFVALVVVVLLSALLVGGYVLYLISKLFNLPSPTYKKSLIVSAGAATASFLVSLGLLIFFPSIATATQLILPVLAFFIFHLFLRRYYEISWLKSLGVYAVFTVLCLLMSAAVVAPIRLYVVQPFMVSGEAMSPTYPSGEYMLINQLDKEFSRGEVIVFRYPKDPTQFFIKRVVGLPTEKVEVKQGRVFINDQLLEEPYYAGETTGSVATTLGKDEYFVLGDNRAASADSRTFGSVPKSNILGSILLDVANFGR